jgi:hypothetical protein
MIGPRAVLFAFGLGAILGAGMYGCAHAADHPTAREIAACGGDAQRICGAGPMSDPSKIASCLIAYRASLGKPCAALLLSEGK